MGDNGAPAREPSAEELRELLDAYTAAAVHFGTTPTMVNRFLAMPQGPGLVAYIFGGGGLIFQPDKGYAPVVRPLVALTFAKNVAEDLVVSLCGSYGISDDDLQKAKDRTVKANTP